MTISGISYATPAPTLDPTANAANAASSSLSQNYNTFITMLTTQLKNQDPLSPMDSTQFTQQLVMYSQVEQQMNTNSELKQMVAAQSAGQAASALNYIGMQVTAPGSQFTYSGQPVDLGYALPSNAASTNIAIVDNNGNMVWSGTGNTTQGSYNFNWDGTDLNGNAVANGTYTLVVSAVDTNKTQLSATTAVPGIVTGVETDNGTVYLNVNGTAVPESSVSGAQTPTKTS
jgi:flagellar basal-body rod modification protein FlgD